MTNGGSAIHVSVIIPSHNRPAMLREALESVAKQTFQDFEVIVVDDGSEPKIRTNDLQAKLGPPIKIIHHETAKGGAGAKNSGVKASSGEILSFLDDDDLYAPTYLERALDVLDRHQEIDIVFMGVSWFGSEAMINEDAQKISLQRFLNGANPEKLANNLLLFNGRSLFDELLYSVPMTFQRPVVRRKMFEKVGCYRENCLMWDNDWVMRASLQAKTALLLDGLYMQRAGTHAYHSTARKLIDRFYSQIEMEENLLRELVSKKLCIETVQCRKALAHNWFNLAYYLCQKKASRRSLLAWLRSQQYLFCLKRFRFFGRYFWEFIKPTNAS